MQFNWSVCLNPIALLLKPLFTWHEHRKVERFNIFDIFCICLSGVTHSVIAYLQVCDALGECKRDIKNCKGPQPEVPLHLRNAPTKLMRDLNYGQGYHMGSDLECMPEGMESRNYFL